MGRRLPPTFILIVSISFSFANVNVSDSYRIHSKVSESMTWKVISLLSF